MRTRNTPAPVRTANDAGTAEQLLDAAEELFAEQGYAGTSLRQVTTAAGANVAAVNYHFGGKEGLAKAVLARRIAPINAERLRRLDELRGRRVDLEDIVRAFVEPPLRARGCATAASPADRMCRVFGRIIVEQPPFLREFLAVQFRAVAGRFAREFERVAPGLGPSTTWWRLHFVVGAMAHVLQNAAALSDVSDGHCNLANVEQMIEELVSFAVGGIAARAPRARRRAPAREKRTPRKAVRR